MKKVLLFAVAAFAFASCGNSSSSNKAQEEVVVTEAEVVTSCDSCGGCSTDSTSVCATETVPADSTSKN